MQDDQQIVSDGGAAYYHSKHGIKVIPHSENWIAYYRLGEGYGKWNLILIAFCQGNPPGILNISIRAWEDLAKFYGKTY